jgi:hypothetical protein
MATVKGPGQINVNTARREVLRALGLSDAEISEIDQFRRVAPYTAATMRFGRGLAVTSQTFRIEAQGLIDGQVRARVTAIVAKRTDGGGEGLTVLEWSGVH